MGEDAPGPLPLRGVERDRLFGRLAVRLGFVPDHVLDELTAGPPGELPRRLIEARALDPSEVSAIEVLLAQGLEGTLLPEGSEGSKSIEGDRTGTDLMDAGALSLGDEPGPRTPSAVDPRVTAEDPGRYVGRREVGRGGLGRILRTRDGHLARDVARKELLIGPIDAAQPSGTHTQAIARFLREARVTAQLEHPNIVPVYELGRGRAGELYYTMKLVRGRTLKAALTECLDLQDRLQLLPHFVDLCQAIAYAHSRGVIHRDIKPDNVMIGEFGETLVLDWGVAKVRGSEDLRQEDLARAVARLEDEDHAKTLPGSAFGTPSFMSPEQAKGQIDRIDERSDVWSLGVVLYQLLSGRLPYGAANLMQLLMRVAEADVTPIEQACPDGPPELLAITRAALASDPADRYRTAKELAEEVQAFQAGERVDAHQYSTREQLARLVRQHRGAVIASAVGAVVLVMVMVGAWLGLVDERDRARAAEQAARASVADALVARADLSAQLEGWTAAEVLLAGALAEVDRPDVRGALALLADELRPALAWREQTYAGCADLTWSTRAELACATSLGVQLFDGDSGARSGRRSTQGWASAAAFSPDGIRLAGGTEAGEIVIWSPEGDRPEARWPAAGSAVFGLGFVGSSLVIGRADDAVAVAEPPWGEPSRLAPFRGSARLGARLAVGGPRAAWTDRQGQLWTWSGDAVTALGVPGPPASALAVSADGAAVAVATEDRRLRWYDAAGATATVAQVPPAVLRSLSFASDGRFLFAGDDDGRIARFDLESGRADARWLAHEGGVSALAVHGDQLASAGGDRKLSVYEVSGPGRPRPPSSASPLRSAAVSRDWMLALRTDRGIDALLPGERRSLGRDGAAVAIAGTGARWAFAGGDGVTTGTTRRSSPADRPVWLDLGDLSVAAIALDQPGTRLAAGARDGRVRVADLRRPSVPPPWTLTVPGSVIAVAFEPSGASIVALSRSRLAAAGVVDGGERFRVDVTGARGLAVSEGWIAITNERGLDLHRADTGVWVGQAASGRFTAVSLDRAGKRAVVGDEDGRLRVYSIDPPAALLTAEASAHASRVIAVEFTGADEITSADANGRTRRMDLSGLARPVPTLSAELRRRHRLRLDGFEVVLD